MIVEGARVSLKARIRSKPTPRNTSDFAGATRRDPKSSEGGAEGSPPAARHECFSGGSTVVWRYRQGQRVAVSSTGMVDLWFNITDNLLTEIGS